MSVSLSVALWNCLRNYLISINLFLESDHVKWLLCFLCQVQAAFFLDFYLDLVPFLFYTDKGKNGGSGEILDKNALGNFLTPIQYF